MTRPYLMPNIRTRTAFVPATVEGLQVWRKILADARQAATKDLDDLPAFLSLWLEKHRGQPLRAADLVRLADGAGHFKYLLRKTAFKTRCARMGSFLERVVLAQGATGIIPGERISVEGPLRRERVWMADTSEALKERAAARNAASEAAEKAAEERRTERRRTSIRNASVGRRRIP